MKYFLLLLIPSLIFAQSVFNPLPTAPISIFGIPLMQKGSVLVSNGFFLGEKLACADNDILVYDALETDGLGCQPIPVDTNTNAATLCNSGEYLDGDGTCKAIPIDTDTNAGTLCNSGEYLDGDGTCKAIPTGGLIKECQTKFLTADLDVTGAVNDLTFNNLDTLKYYSLTVATSFVYSVGNTCRLTVTSGLPVILKVQNREADAPEDRTNDTVTNPFFQPSGTTLNFTFTENTTCVIEGNGGYAETWATLCELPDYTATTKF